MQLIGTSPNHHSWPWADLFVGTMLFSGIGTSIDLPAQPLVQIVFVACRSVGWPYLLRFFIKSSTNAKVCFVFVSVHLLRPLATFMQQRNNPTSFQQSPPLMAAAQHQRHSSSGNLPAKAQQKPTLTIKTATKTATGVAIIHHQPQQEKFGFLQTLVKI